MPNGRQARRWRGEDEDGGNPDAGLPSVGSRAGSSATHRPPQLAITGGSRPASRVIGSIPIGGSPAQSPFGHGRVAGSDPAARDTLTVRPELRLPPHLSPAFISSSPKHPPSACCRPLYAGFALPLDRFRLRHC